jgi:hypothetical protein
MTDGYLRQLRGQLRNLSHQNRLADVCNLKVVNHGSIEVAKNLGWIFEFDSNTQETIILAWHCYKLLHGNDGFVHWVDG